MVELRELDLDWQAELAGVPLDALTGLPLLATLKLNRFDVVDEHLSFLAEMPSLRALGLTLNHGFTKRGVEAIAACPDLRKLSLTGCSQLRPRDLTPLARLRRLQVLDLESLGTGHRGLIGDEAGHDLQFRYRAEGWKALTPVNASSGGAPSPWRAAELPASLEELRLSATSVGDDDLRVLRTRSPRLRHVELARCSQVTDVGVGELLALEQLRRLDLSGCTNLSRFGLELIAQATQIHQVRLDDLPWLTAQQAEALFQAGIDVELTATDHPLYDSLATWRRDYPLRGR